MRDLGVDYNDGADASIAYGKSEKYIIYGRVFKVITPNEQIEKTNKKIQ